MFPPVKCDGPCQRMLYFEDVQYVHYVSATGVRVEGNRCEDCCKREPKELTKAQQLEAARNMEPDDCDIAAVGNGRYTRLKMVDTDPRAGGPVRRDLSKSKTFLEFTKGLSGFPVESIEMNPDVWDINVPVRRKPEYDPGFHGPEPGSRDRFVVRSAKRPWFSHTFWWVIHNCVAHVVIGLVPITLTFKFHDWTSRKMHGK